LAAAVGLAVAVGVVVLVLLADDGPNATDPSADDAPLLGADQAEDTLRDYLAVVADDDYRAAAVLLVGGDEPLDERDDLAVLDLDELTVESLASALAAYCRDGDCVEPTSVVIGDLDRDRGYEATVDFGEPRGHPVQRTFVVWATSDRQPYVRGLPPRGLTPIPTPSANP
jgi:hypothetical protein